MNAREERWRERVMLSGICVCANPAPCQQLSKDDSGGHVALHAPTKAFRIWRQELGNSIRDCLGVKLDL